eukprot:398569-Rhodomonas_salina.1
MVCTALQNPVLAQRAVVRETGTDAGYGGTKAVLTGVRRVLGQSFIEVGKLTGVSFLDYYKLR